MSEREIRTPEDVHRFLAELDATQPVGSWREVEERAIAQRKEREQRERTRQEREARAAEEKQQRAVVEKQQAASTDWYVAVDTRVRAHFKDWAWAAIDERIREHIEIARKPLVEATGNVFGQFRAQLRAEFKHAIEELMQEIGAQLAAREQRLASNDQVARAVQGQCDEFKRIIEAAQRSFEVKLAEQGEKLREEFRVGIGGRLPVARAWDSDEVCYRGDVVVRDGSVFQALKDTGKAPAVDHPDWILLARAGADAPVLNFRGVFNAYETYARFDVTEFDGSSFVAVRDLDRGTLPGEDGWQLLCRPGSRGPAGDAGPCGERGARGARGKTAPTIVAWTLDTKDYVAHPTLSDGQAGAPLDLRPLFQKFCDEAVSAIVTDAIDAALKDAARG